MGFIFLLLLLLGLWWILSPFIRIYRNVRRARKGDWINLGDLFGTPGAQSESQPRSTTRSGWSGIRRKKKKIDPGVGEYIKFKEIPADPASIPPASADYVAEQQITDVEWEEIS